MRTIYSRTFVAALASLLIFTIGSRLSNSRVSKDTDRTSASVDDSKAPSIVGDGVHDDTRAIQAQINELHNGGIISFGSGQIFKVTSAITIPNKNIILDGNCATFLNSSRNDVVFKVDVHSADVNTCLIKNATFMCDNTVHDQTSECGAILIKKSFGTTIRGCRFFYLRGGFAIKAEGSENLRIETCQFDWNAVDTCIEALQSPEDRPYFTNELSLVACRIQHISGSHGQGGVGVVASGANIAIRDCMINVCAGGGILLGRDWPAYGVVIDNLYCEANSVFDVRASNRKGVSYFRFENITVRDAIQKQDGMGNISKNVRYSVDLQGAEDGTLENYWFTGRPLIASIRVPKHPSNLRLISIKGMK